MKALSIRQPYAWAIVQGHKPVENRTWWTTFRGPVLIHAGKTIDEAGCLDVAAILQITHFTVRQYANLTGGIVGIATIVDCVEKFDSPWFSGPFGFVLKDARPLPFLTMCGQLGFFDVDDDLLRRNYGWK